MLMSQGIIESQTEDEQMGPFSCRKPSNEEQPGPPLYSCQSRELDFADITLPFVQNSNSSPFDALFVGQNLSDCQAFNHGCLTAGYLPEEELSRLVGRTTDWQQPSPGRTSIKIHYKASQYLHSRTSEVHTVGNRSTINKELLRGGVTEGDSRRRGAIGAFRRLRPGVYAWAQEVAHALETFALDRS